jgi:hypothetical protein
MPGAAEQSASQGLGRPPVGAPTRQVVSRQVEPPAPLARTPEPPRTDARSVAKQLGDTLPGVPSPVGDEAVDLPAPTPKSSVPAAMPVPTQPVALMAPEVVTDLRQKLESLALSKEQIDGVLALSREIVEQVVWEVVPTLAETLIKEEIQRLMRE